MNFTIPVRNRSQFITLTFYIVLASCLIYSLRCNAQSLTSPRDWPDQIEVTDHPQKQYKGVYVQSARLINGLPVYEIENKRETTDSLYRYNYLYCHKLTKEKNEAQWVLQPVTPYADEWLANSSGWGTYPWNAAWGAGKISVKQLPASRKRELELPDSKVDLPKLRYKTGKSGKKIIGFMFRVPLKNSKEWISVEKSGCDEDIYPFAVKNAYYWRERHPGTNIVFNTNFFEPNGPRYDKSTCAKIFGIAIKDGVRVPKATKTEKDKKTGIEYQLDALLIHKDDNASIISGRRALYDPNSPLLGTVNSAAGGYIILERGHEINPEGMIKLHAGNSHKARIAVGIKSIHAEELFVFIIPSIEIDKSKNEKPPVYPEWESDPSKQEPIGPTDGMTMGELQTFMKDEGMQHGIMFDGGGSAAVMWRTPPVGTANKSMRYRIPPFGKNKDIDVSTGKRILRKVPSVMGF